MYKNSAIQFSVKKHQFGSQNDDKCTTRSLFFKQKNCSLLVSRQKLIHKTVVSEFGRTSSQLMFHHKNSGPPLNYTTRISSKLTFDVGGNMGDLRKTPTLYGKSSIRESMI